MAGWWGHRSPAEGKVESEDGATTAQHQDRRASLDAGLASATRTHAPEPLHAAIRLSPDAREFHQNAHFKDLYDRLAVLPAPNPEQKFILSEILSRCGSEFRNVRQAQAAKKQRPDPAELLAKFAASLSETDPDRERRIAAYGRVREAQSPCDGFGEVANAEALAKSLAQAAADAGDPGARASRLRREIASGVKQPDGSVQQRVTDAQLATVQEIVASRDPFAASVAMWSLAYGGLENASLRAGPAQSALDQNAFQAAMNALQCESSQDCGPDSRLYAYQLAPASAALLDPYLEGMRRAQAGDWSYYTIARTPSPMGVAMRR